MLPSPDRDRTRSPKYDIVEKQVLYQRARQFQICSLAAYTLKKNPQTNKAVFLKECKAESVNYASTVLYYLCGHREPEKHKR